jgi:hypothetical protein
MWFPLNINLKIIHLNLYQLKENNQNYHFINNFYNYVITNLFNLRRVTINFDNYFTINLNVS